MCREMHAAIRACYPDMSAEEVWRVLGRRGVKPVDVLKEHLSEELWGELVSQDKELTGGG